MSEENYKVQWSVSLPPAAQYAKGDMLNIRGESAEEVEALFDSILNGEFVDKATEVANAVRIAASFGQPTDTAPSGREQNEAAQQTQQPAAGSGKFCNHGQRTVRTGHSAKGAWTGYFCPLPKGDPNQCDAVWG